MPVHPSILSEDPGSSLGPEALCPDIFRGHMKVLMEDAVQRMNHVVATANTLLQIAKLGADQLGHLPSGDLVYLNELKSDIIHDSEQISKAHEDTAVEVMRLALKYDDVEELAPCVEVLLCGFEGLRNRMKKKVDVIDQLRAAKPDEIEEEFEFIEEPVEVTTENHHIRQPDWAGDIIRNQGPMVVLNNLPTNITYAQVMDGVTGLGGISRVLVKPEPAATRKGAWCAVVHFKTSKAAKDYFQFFKEKPLFFEDKDEELQKASMLLYEPTTPPDDEDQGHLSGRCVDFDHFHGPAIWAALEKIGLSIIVRVAFSPDTSGDLGSLSVEVVDVAQASRVREIALQHRALPGFSGRSEDLADGLCESDFPPSHIYKLFDNVIRHVEPDYLEAMWNRAPYNTWAPHKRLQPEAEVRQPRKHPLRERTDREAFRIRMHVSLQTGNPDAVCMTLLNTTYLAKRGSVFKYAIEPNATAVEVRGQELVDLQNSTINDDTWVTFWTKYLQQQNILAPDEYARMVEHRRLRAEGKITCPVDCQTCKPDIRRSPVPLRARMYTHASEDGFPHSSWLRKEDEETRRSISRMTPRMGRILRSR
ncbi:hypothetical protein N0V84_002598 [Fusarium piperis]|uniref:RRM domain-containing protein n=1 Tax=Fusarium piperis TaxID=1435070 RepID=A0A9W9BRY9_9HYPO|nr:hypothetical protein N0V84_002598 [Fusarium piperis]